MKDFMSHIPDIDFGAGASAHLGTHAASIGNRACIVMDPFLFPTELTSRILDDLEIHGIEAMIFHDVQADPDTNDIDQAAKIAREFRADMVIGVGGGSSIDFAKGIAVVMNNPGRAWEYTRRRDHVARTPGKQTLPIIAVPTTSGTGSEVTPFSVLSNRELNEKSTIVDRAIIPRIAVVDPELTYSMPPWLTALTGADVLSHAVEALINTQAHHFSKMASREAISFVGKYLVRTFNDGGDVEARDGMAWASCMAGVAIAHANPTLPHAVGQAIGGFAHIPHGASIAANFSEIMRRTWKNDITGFSEIAALLNPAHDTSPDEYAALQAVAEIETLLETIGCVYRYADYGVSEQDLPSIADITITNYFTGVSQHPYRADKAEIVSILKACL